MISYKLFSDVFPPIYYYNTPIALAHTLAVQIIALLDSVMRNVLCTVDASSNLAEKITTFRLGATAKTAV